MRRLSLAPFAVSLLLLAGAAFAAPAPAPGTALTGKIAITGDDFVIDDAHHQATFTGNVVVTQMQWTVDADKVVAFYAAGGNIQSFEATGHVKIISKTETATGDKAVYDPATRLMKLTGATVVVTTATGQVQSTELVVDLNKNTSVFTNSRNGGRVTGVFNSQ